MFAVSSLWFSPCISISSCRPCSSSFSSSSPTRGSWQTCTTPLRRVWTLLTSSPSPQVMSRRPHDFYELLISPALLSYTTPHCGPGLRRLYTRGICSIEHIEHKSVTLYEKICLSVCRRRQCSIEQGNLSEIDQGNPGEHKSSEAQIRTLLDEQKQKVLAECQARISQHEFQAAQAEEEQRLVQ